MKKVVTVVVLVVLAGVALTGVAVGAFTDRETNPQTLTAASPFPGYEPELKVQSKQSPITSGNVLSAPFKLVNTGASAIALSRVTVRYWFTRDNSTTNAASCSAGCTGVSTSVGTVSPVRVEADRYILVSYTAAAGQLAAGGSKESTARVIGSSGINFDRSNDYSNTATSLTTFRDNAEMTVYVDGDLVWGQEPRVASVGLTARSRTVSTPTSQISFALGLRNTGDLPVDLANVTMRYWFSRDSVTNLTASCVADCTGVTVRVVTVTGVSGTDRYVEVDSSLGQTLSVGASIDGPRILISRTGITGSFNQTNDWSYLNRSTLTDNQKVTAYNNGNLVGGTPP